MPLIIHSRRCFFILTAIFGWYRGLSYRLGTLLRSGRFHPGSGFLTIVCVGRMDQNQAMTAGIAGRVNWPWFFMIKPRLAANWSEECLFPKHAPLG